jgi:hypothetical protein
MKKIPVYIILFVLPCTFFFTTLSLKKAYGPTYQGIRYDPDYAYLFASLNAAGFKGTKLTVHPGTPIHIMGGIYLRLHSLNYPALQEDVIKRPEYYLNSLNNFIIVLVALLLIVIGLVTYSLAGDIVPGLIIQMTPFFSKWIIYALLRYNPDTFLVFSALLLVTAVLIRFHKLKDDNWKSVLLFSGVAGFGLAVKLPFLPLMFIPFFLFKKISANMKYVLLSMAVFFAFQLPYFYRISYTTKFLWNLFVHSGKHGRGSSGVIDAAALIPNLKKIFQGEKLFMYTLIFLILFILVNVAVPKLRRIALKSPIFKLLLGLSIADIVGITVTLKHFGPRYLIPCLSLTGLAIVFIYLYLKELSFLLEFNFKFVKFLFIFLMVFVAVYFYNRLPDNRRIEKKRDEKLVVHQKLGSTYKDYKKIFYYGSTSKMYALYFGNLYAEFEHTTKLRSIYGDNFYFYSIRFNKFFEWRRRIGLNEFAESYSNLIMVGPAMWGRKKNNIIKVTRKAFAAYNLKLINTMPENKYDTIFTFEKLDKDKPIPLKPEKKRKIKEK